MAPVAADKITSVRPAPAAAVLVPVVSLPAAPDVPADPELPVAAGSTPTATTPANARTPTITESAGNWLNSPADTCQSELPVEAANAVTVGPAATTATPGPRAA